MIHTYEEFKSIKGCLRIKKHKFYIKDIVSSFGNDIPHSCIIFGPQVKSNWFRSPRDLALLLLFENKPRNYEKQEIMQVKPFQEIMQGKPFQDIMQGKPSQEIVQVKKKYIYSEKAFKSEYSEPYYSDSPRINFIHLFKMATSDFMRAKNTTEFKNIVSHGVVLFGDIPCELETKRFVAWDGSGDDWHDLTWRPYI